MGLSAHRTPTRAPKAFESDRGESTVPRGRRRAHSKHRRTRSQRLSARTEFLTRVVLPAGALVLLAALCLGAWLLAPERPGPLPSGVTLALMLILGPVLFAAARRLGLGSGAAVLAAASAILLTTSASADTVGVPEHVAVQAGLLAILVWPGRDGSRARSLIAAVLVGSAIAISPLAAAPAVVAVALLALRTASHDRGRAVLLPASVSASVAVIALVMLMLIPGAVESTVWGGSVALATAVVALAPAIGLAAGAAVERAFAAMAGREPRTLFAGVAGALALGLVFATVSGATISRVHDRVVVSRSPTRRTPWRRTATATTATATATGSRTAPSTRHRSPR